MKSALCAGLALLFFPLSVSALAPAEIVGDWFGTGQPNDEKMAYLDHIRPDGTFTSEFERCRGKVTIRSVQTGTWAASTDMLRVDTKIVDGKPSHFVTDYQMLSNDGKNWSYRIAASEPEDPPAVGYLFTAKRVPHYFQMPGCLQIS